MLRDLFIAVFYLFLLFIILLEIIFGRPMPSWELSLWIFSGVLNLWVVIGYVILYVDVNKKEVLENE